MNKLTPRQQQVYDALPLVDFEWPGVIARKAGIRTMSSSETAAKFCIQLVKLGLAEKGGTRSDPRWRRATPPQPIAGEGMSAKAVAYNFAVFTMLGLIFLAGVYVGRQMHPPYATVVCTEDKRILARGFVVDGLTREDFEVALLDACTRRRQI